MGKEIVRRLTALGGRIFVGFLVISAVLVATLVVDELRIYYEFTLKIWLGAFVVLSGKAGVQNVASIVKNGGKNRNE
jgi:hypothetical protein